MAILVLVVGAALAVAGAGEIFYGSGMIEIERGWSTFIAGTILLVGGVLTMALGLALRALGEVRGVLLQLGGLASGEGAAAAFPARAEIAPAGREPVALRPVEPAMQLEGAGLQIEPHFGIAPAAAIEAAPQAPLRLRDEPAPPHGEALRPAAPATDDWLERQLDELGRDPEPSPAAEARGLHEAYERPRDGRSAPEARETGPHRDEPVAVPAAAPVPAPAEPEHAYADYVELPAPEPAPISAAPISAAPMPAAAEPVAASAPPAATAAPTTPAPTAPPPAQPAVIGRYESDGTSYVMFADGSIEAQSEAGIYRFASMAELRSFIET